MNQRIKVLITEVREGARGPEIIVSRANSKLVEALFALEVPEIANGTVKVEEIAREPGERTKIAVSSTQENVDPVGSCVGQKGIRVQAVIAELGEEKIDIIHHSSDTEKYIANALSPAKVIEVKLNKKKKQAKVIVFDDQLSLAIGKEGQNVRLAAKLTGWRIDIAGSKAKGEAPSEELGLSKRVVNALAAAKITDLKKLKEMSDEELKEIKGLGPKAIEEIKNAL